MCYARVCAYARVGVNERVFMDNRPQDRNTENSLADTVSETPAGASLPEDKAPGKLNWKYAIAGTLLLVVLIVATFAFLHNASELDFRILPKMLLNSSPAFIALGFLCVLSHIYCEGRAMAAAARGIGIKIGHVRSTLYACAELFFAAVTPSASGGQPAVAYFMYKDGIRVSRSSVILLTNTLHSTTSLLFLGLVTLVFRYRLITQTSADNATLGILFVLGFVANVLGMLSCLLFIFAPGLIKALGVPVFRLLAKLHIIKDLEARLESFEESLREYKECQHSIIHAPKAQIKTFLWNIGQRVSVCAVSYFVYRALGFSQASVFDVLFIQFIVIFTVNAIPLPGAAGASELITRELYMGLYGAELAVPAMLFSRSVSFYTLVILCGLVTLFWYVRTARRKYVRS